MGATSVLIVGESGSGKSTSIKTLPPEETFIINIADKSLPFKGFKKFYTPLTSDNPKGNLIATAEAAKILNTMDYVNTKRPEIKYLIIEDNQYMATDYLMKKLTDKGFDKFVQVASMIYQIATKGKSMREDLIIFILNHQEPSGDEGERVMKAKTAGKMIDSQVGYEGLFTIVLFTYKEETKTGVNYGFVTNGDTRSTAKSPEGMFEERRIPNDLKYVADKVKEYEY